MADAEHTHEGRFVFHVRRGYSRRARLKRCEWAVFIEKCSAAPAPNPHQGCQCAPKRSDWVAMRTSMKNAPNAAVRQIMAATNKMATAPDKLMETNDDAKSDITTSETNRADIVQSAIAVFM